MAITTIRRKSKKSNELVIQGQWGDYFRRNNYQDFQETIITPQQFKEMLDELKAAEMHTSANQYEQELDALHRRREDYDMSTGKPVPDTKADYARRVLVEGMKKKDEELYNPLHDDYPEKDRKLNKGSEFSTKDAADALSQIEGVQRGPQIGHDIDITYKGRTKKLMGGSGRTGMTNANAVDQILDMIVEQDAAKGHIQDNNRGKRRDALKNAIYKT